MDLVRIGFIGAGRFANEVHYPCLAAFEDVRIAAVCDADPVRLRATADSYSVPHAFLSYREMLDKTQPDAVYICMPPHHLFDIVCDCLKRGLHVFMEKPPGVAAEQARAFARLARASGSLTMVGFNRRFMPVLVEVRRRLEERGALRHCAASYLKHYPVDVPYYDGPASMLILDGIHAVDTLRWLGGEVESVTSHTSAWCSGYSNAFRALIKFENGCTGMLNADWAAGCRVQTVEMHAAGASSFVDIDDCARIYSDDNPQPEILDVKQIAGSNEFRIYYGFEAENRHFIDCIKAGRLPENNFDEAVRTMELVEAIERGEI